MSKNLQPAYTVLRDIMVGMRDGIRLATDVYLPKGEGPFPVLLERTPYDKRGTNHADRTARNPTPVSKPEIARQFVEAGYAYVLQDCRGRFGSEGSFVKYLGEGDDGADTLDWIHAQTWCDGHVGMLGLSYGAHVQTAVAATGTLVLGAMFIDSGGFSNAYRSGIRQGGAFELKQLTWAYKHALLSPLTRQDSRRRECLEQQNIADWINHTPWSEGHSPLAAAPEYEAYVLEQWRNETYGPYWKRPAINASLAWSRFPRVPMVHMSSWYDPYAMTATENFVGLKRAGHEKIWLIMGPWTHGQRSVTYAGNVDFGPSATLDGAIAPDYVALRRAWFDRHLRQIEVDDHLPKPVKLFVMGGGSGRCTEEGRLDHGGRWRDEESWPLPDTDFRPFYLSPEGGLLSDAPKHEAGSVSFLHDPTRPVPSIGGAIASGAPVMSAGGFDQRETADLFGAECPGRALADRPDVAVFQTPPLEGDIEVTGPIKARLFVSSSAVDTDFTIKLVDVYPPSEDYPEGYALNLTHGILRMRFRNSFERIELLEPGVTYEIEVEAFPTSNLFKAGHRIRIDIASSNFPHFDVNPNNGAPAGGDRPAVTALNRVHANCVCPSHVILPVIPRR